MGLSQVRIITSGSPFCRQAFPLGITLFICFKKAVQDCRSRCSCGFANLYIHYGNVFTEISHCGRISVSQKNTFTVSASAVSKPQRAVIS